MIRSIFLNCCLALFGLFLLASCGQSNTQGRYIPKDAAVVVIVNGKSFTEKLPWDEVKSTAWYAEMQKDSSMEAFVRSALENPAQTGMDIRKDLIFFMVKDSLGGYIVMEAEISDENVFTKYLDKVPELQPVTEKEGIRYRSARQLMVSWKDKRMVMAINAPMLRNIADPLSEKSVQEDGPMPAKNRNLMSLCSGIHTLAEKKSLAGDDKLSELMKKQGDLHFWMSTEALNSGTPAYATLSMLNISKLYKDSYTTGVVNFENGKILMDMRSYSGKEMTDIARKYSGSGMNTEMAKALPLQKTALYFSMNFKPEGIREFMKLAGLDGFANMGSSYLGFNLDDFISANKGDISIGLGDFTKDTASLSEMPDLTVVFSAAIGNRDAFQKLMAAGKKMVKEEMGSSAEKNIFVNLNKNYFALGNKQSAVDAAIAGKSGTNPSFIAKLKDHPIGLYVNIPYMLEQVGPSAMSDSLERVAYTSSLAFWDEIYYTGGRFHDGGLDQQMELNLKQKDMNSLKALNQYLSKMVSVMVAREERQKHMMRSSEPITLSTEETD